MRICMSTSIPAGAQELMKRFQEAGRVFGMEVTLSPRPWESLNAVPNEVGSAIEQADFILYWAAQGGADFAYMNLEAGFVRNVCPETPVALFTDENIHPGGCLEWQDKVVFVPSDPRRAVHEAWDKTERACRALGEEKSVRLRGWFLAIVGLWMSHQAALVPAAAPAPAGAQK